MITEPLAQLFLLAAVVHVALLLQQRFAMFRSFGAPLLTVLAGIALSNSGILPGQSPVYDFMTRTGVNIAILLILLGVNVQSVLQAGPKMMAAFGVGAFGSVAGAVAASLLFSNQVGPESWKLAGMFAASYVGGGVNFASVAQAFDTSSHLFTAAVASDVIVSAAWFAATLLVPMLVRGDRETVGLAEPDETAEEYAATVPVRLRRDKGAVTSTVAVEARETNAVTKPVPLERTLHDSGRSLALSHVAGLTAYVAAGLWLSALLGSLFPAIPAVVWLSTLALLAAQLRALRELPGGAMLGNYLLLLFMTCNGARSVAATIVQVGPSIFSFALVTVLVHGVVIFGVGRLLRFDWGTLAIASQANVGGVAKAMAVATSLGDANRLLPGIAVALLGYAMGNYIGIAVGALVRIFLAG